MALVLALRELRDHLAEAEERLVDGLSLLRSIALREALLQPLAARQVDEGDLPVAPHALPAGLLLPGRPLRVDPQREQGVRARGIPVHLRRPDSPVVDAGLEASSHVRGALARDLLQVADKEAMLPVVPDLQIARLGVEQVADALVHSPGRVIDLRERRGHRITHAALLGRAVARDPAEEALGRAHDEAVVALHVLTAATGS
mmetsp:Transcript_120783/g.301370  ORF Transcript_120783/g.301370 Transcript_120783/m.301370 type:complete len:202 (+) Transcript_120783:279-884(+)